MYLSYNLIALLLRVVYNVNMFNIKQVNQSKWTMTLTISYIAEDGTSVWDDPKKVYKIKDYVDTMVEELKDRPQVSRTGYDEWVWYDYHEMERWITYYSLKNDITQQVKIN